ncbi:MAG: type IV pilus twitching motility protein PilT [Coxiellaceae bacterium]|jgi:twitching motility protein PilT|nr:type IV pilus twitching motility protein PilT [Coxiellaceae bacterium]
MDINELLRYTVLHHASDLHLSSGVKPMIRVDNDLRVIGDNEELSEQDIRTMLSVILPEPYKADLASQFDIDCGFEITDLSARFRVNIFQQERGISVAIRYISLIPPTLAELNLSKIFYELCNLHHGLIIVTGPTGSGKSTTLAAMIDYINSTRPSHILTIEDPIEYVHNCKKCLIQQREVKKHTKSFNDALRAALREDPDYILVGEMRDLETIRLALTAAETGHLVFATLHTNSAADSIDRVVDVFPTFEKSLIRSMVANSLQAVISQRLLKKTGGGRVAAEEIMICTTAIRNLIRENKTYQIYSAIQTGQGKGMQTMSSGVRKLMQQGLVNEDEYHYLIED